MTGILLILASICDLLIATAAPTSFSYAVVAVVPWQPLPPRDPTTLRMRARGGPPQLRLLPSVWVLVPWEPSKAPAERRVCVVLLLADFLWNIFVY